MTILRDRARIGGLPSFSIWFILARTKHLPIKVEPLKWPTKAKK